MILVLLGTFPTGFPRPLKEIEVLCKDGVIEEEVIVQSGHTMMESPYMQMRPFIPPDELTELCLEARFLISHAGTGSLIKGLKLNKKIIAVARLSKYNEMVDDHQVEILKEFTDSGYILPWHEKEPLSKILASIDSFMPSSYISNKQNIINYLDQYIDSL